MLRHVDFTGLYTSGRCDAATLPLLIKDVLLRLGWSLDDCRGQCYDGASAMSGIHSGVQARIAEEQPNAFYGHCTEHSLNLVLHEATRSVLFVRDTIDLVHEIIKFVRDSPKRLAIFSSIEVQDGEP